MTAAADGELSRAEREGDIPLGCQIGCSLLHPIAAGVFSLPFVPPRKKPSFSQSYVCRTFVLTKLTIVSVDVATLCFFFTWSATLAINASSVPASPCQRQAWSASLHRNW